MHRTPYFKAHGNTEYMVRCKGSGKPCVHSLVSSRLSIVDVILLVKGPLVFQAVDWMGVAVTRDPIIRVGLLDGCGPSLSSFFVAAALFQASGASASASCSRATAEMGLAKQTHGRILVDWSCIKLGSKNERPAERSSTSGITGRLALRTGFSGNVVRAA
eukprot:1141525-Pelagomonas_calceolata.AAC.3